MYCRADSETRPAGVATAFVAAALIRAARLSSTVFVSGSRLRRRDGSSPPGCYRSSDDDGAFRTDGRLRLRVLDAPADNLR
jgi:hypothetical protein